jgi:hypothetical protein
MTLTDEQYTAVRDLEELLEVTGLAELDLLADAKRGSRR